MTFFLDLVCLELHSTSPCRPPHLLLTLRALLRRLFGGPPPQLLHQRLATVRRAADLSAPRLGQVQQPTALELELYNKSKTGLSF